MDILVCGEFAWISCGTWLGFWSGGIGAVVAAALGVLGALLAAIIGGLVALLVVRLTNAQQRHAAERAVEVAALGECVAAMEGLEWAMRRYDSSKPFDVGMHLIPMRAAVARLQMSRKEAIPISEVLIHWPGNLSALAEEYKTAALEDAPPTDELLGAVTKVSTFATVSLPWCSSSDLIRKQQAMNLLYAADRDLRAAVDRSDARKLQQSS